MTGTQITFEDKAQLLNKINQMHQKMISHIGELATAKDRYDRMYEAMVQFEQIQNKRIKEQKDIIRYLKKRLGKYEFMGEEQ